MLDANTLRGLIRSTLTPLNVYSPAAEELLMATCAQESLLGTYRTQAPHGPARGIFQDEGEDFDDLWANYLAYHPTLANQLKALNGGQQGTVDDLVNNDAYAIAICRVHYMRAPGALPDQTSLDAMWAYYKRWYNTPQGAATQAQFVQHYKLTGGTAA